VGTVNVWGHVAPDPGTAWTDLQPDPGTTWVRVAA
jgi:hypothetical protein